MLLRDTLYRVAVEPTRRIQIDFDGSNGGGLSIIRDLAPRNGGWFMELCPTRWRARISQAAHRDPSRRSVLERWWPPFRTPFALCSWCLATDEARCNCAVAAATGQDLTTAVRVIDLLSGVAR
jgi:hypothetical protein